MFKSTQTNNIYECLQQGSNEGWMSFNLFTKQCILQFEIYNSKMNLLHVYSVNLNANCVGGVPIAF